jgi:hypothetical protein
MFPDDPSTLTIVVVLVLIVAMVAVAAYYLVRLLRSFRLIRNDLMPLGGKVAFWAALAYLVFPIDVLPDPLLIDDIAIVATAVTYIGRLARNVGIGPAVAEVMDAIDTTTDSSELGGGTSKE